MTLAALLSLPGLASADVQECRVLNGKMTCEMVRPGRRLHVSSQPRQMFLGKVTNVLDHETLQVETDGKTVRVRPVIHSAWAISAAEVRVVCLNRMVAVYIRQADTDTVLADVLLDNVENLSTVLAQATRESPAAGVFRTQQVEKKAREQAEVHARRAAAVSAPVASVEGTPTPSIPPMWLFREYRSAALPGVILEGVTTRSFGSHGHSLEGTLRNRTSIPLVFIKLTLEWQNHGTVSDTTTTYAVTSEPLPPGGAKMFQTLTSAQANDYRILLSIPGMSQPIVFTPELR